MGSICGQRIQSRVGLPASPGSGPALHSTPSIGGRAGGSRDLQASEQGSSEKGFSLHRPVREQDIHGDQEGRLVVNLKPLNRFVTKKHFKMENAAMVRSLLRKDDWMTTIDLKDAFLSVPIQADHRKFLRFQWKGALYEFQQGRRR